MTALGTGSRDLAALAVLALLSERPNHPYGLQTEIRERHIDFAEGKTRALYHAVERLQHAGLIEPIETTREGRRPERTVYRLTPNGKDVLQAWLIDLLAREEQPVPFMAALSLISHVPVDDAIRALEARKVHLECAVEVRLGVDRVLRERYELPRSVLLDHEYQSAATTAQLEWLNGVLDDLRTQRLQWDPEVSPLGPARASASRLGEPDQ
jgi:DNA-binding PadR family transcriptional regulator